MSTLTLYSSSAPVFAKMLNAMGGWLDKAEAHAAAKKFETSVYCVSRLAPDMLPLSVQFHLAAAFAKNAMCRLADQPPPDFALLEDNFAAYRARIAETLAIIDAIKPEAFEGADTRQMTIQVSREKSLTMDGQAYLLNFILPNFYFHSTTAYVILRHNGVDLGKADFMGAQT